MAIDHVMLPVSYLWEMADLTDAEFGRLIRGLLSYAITGIEPNLPGAERKYWKIVKENHDSYVESYSRPKGKWHWNWKGGITPENQKARASGEAARWRKAVYQRDNYTCQHCGQRGGKLNAHHLKPWAKFPALRYDVENGITLCEQCHKKEHKDNV